MRHTYCKVLLCAALVPAIARAADPSDVAVTVPPVEYRSAIGAYRGHAAEPIGSWQDANARVGRRGGAPMHEGHGTLPAGDAQADPSATTEPATPDRGHHEEQGAHEVGSEQASGSCHHMNEAHHHGHH
jgi:hypothetical protein